MPPFRSFLEEPLEKSDLTRLDFAAEVYRQRNLSAEARMKPPEDAHGELSKHWRLKYPYQPVGYYLKRGPKPMFIPHPLEVRPCCWTIATPINDHPHGWHRHCRTLVHVATLLNVDVRDLRKLVKPKRMHCQKMCGRFAQKDTGYCSRCAFIHRLDAEDAAC